MRHCTNFIPAPNPLTHTVFVISNSKIFMQSVCLLLPCFHHTHVSSCALSCGYFLTKSEFLYFIKFCKLLSESSSTIILLPWVQVSTAVRATRILRGRYNLKANLVLNSQQPAFEYVKFFQNLTEVTQSSVYLEKIQLQSIDANASPRSPTEIQSKSPDVPIWMLIL